MRGRRADVGFAVLACALIVAACGGSAGDADATVVALPEAPAVIADLAPVTEPPTSSTTTAPTTTTPPTTATPTTVDPSGRDVVEQAWVPFGVVGDIVLHHPSDQVEVIGFHQSNHEGAQPIQVLDTAVRPVQLEDRFRASHQQSAADIAIHPDRPVRAPVSGRILRATTYTLYCDNVDEFAVIEPTGHPGIEVKVLHIVGLRVRPGDDVVAGETVLADTPRVLPFVSDVDVATAEPSWPHTHVEVVDTSIPNVRSPNSGSSGC